MNQSTGIHYKVICNDQMRRFQFSGTEFSSLQDHVKQLLGLNREFVLKYKDNENDMITLSSTEELACAIDISQKGDGGLLRLTVFFPEPSTTPIHVPIQSEHGRDFCHRGRGRGGRWSGGGRRCHGGGPHHAPPEQRPCNRFEKPEFCHLKKEENPWEKPEFCPPKENENNSAEKPELCTPKENEENSTEKPDLCPPKENEENSTEKFDLCPPKEKEGISIEKSDLCHPKENEGNSIEKSDLCPPKENEGNSAEKPDLCPPKENEENSAEEPELRPSKEKRGFRPPKETCHRRQNERNPQKCEKKKEQHKEGKKREAKNSKLSEEAKAEIKILKSQIKEMKPTVWAVEEQMKIKKLAIRAALESGQKTKIPDLKKKEKWAKKEQIEPLCQRVHQLQSGK